MGDSSRCIGFFRRFLTGSTPRGDATDYRLATGLDIYMLNRDPLLTLTTVPIERFDQSGVRPRKFLRLLQVLAPTFARTDP